MVSADREALAQAIQRRTKLAGDLLRIQAAREPARTRAREAEQTLATAELALREHAEAEPRALVDALIGGEPVTDDDGRPLREALAAATEALALAHRVSRALAERERETQAELDDATAATKQAAVRVVRNSPEAAAAVAALAAARRTIADLQSVGASVPGVFPVNWDVLPADDIAANRAAIKSWQEALSNLEDDAAATLPLIELSAGASSPSPSASSPAGFNGGSPAGEDVRPSGRAA